MGLSSRVSAATRLHDLLEGAAATLVVTRYDFQVPRDLALWGYDVVEARVSATAEPTKGSGGMSAPASDAGAAGAPA